MAPLGGNGTGTAMVAPASIQAEAMSGRRWLQPREWNDIADAVIVARAGGATWKELADRYGYSRQQLWRVSRERMQQQKPGMQHRETCATPAFA